MRWPIKLEEAELLLSFALSIQIVRFTSSTLTCLLLIRHIDCFLCQHGHFTIYLPAVCLQNIFKHVTSKQSPRDTKTTQKILTKLGHETRKTFLFHFLCFNFPLLAITDHHHRHLSFYCLDFFPPRQHKKFSNLAKSKHRPKYFPFALAWRLRVVRLNNETYVKKFPHHKNRLDESIEWKGTPEFIFIFLFRISLARNISISNAPRLNGPNHSLGWMRETFLLAY